MSLSSVIDELRCPQCRGELKRVAACCSSGPEALHCAKCSQSFPVIDEIPRMLPPALQAALGGNSSIGKSSDLQVQTARSFGFEWSKFCDMRPEWEDNFRGYMMPHNPEFLRGKRVLEAGCGNGRHSFYAGKYGARLWAMDIGPAIDVARRNTRSIPGVQMVQADLHHPPFALESFDFIYSIGVLHHLIDPEAAFRNLVRFLKPGGKIQIYLYWKVEGKLVKALLLHCVTLARQITTRLPHRLLYWLSYPAALMAMILFVWPYQIMRFFPRLHRAIEGIPMKQYAAYPFGVCVNDQFDRFSAPIENRYTRCEVEKWFKDAGLEEAQVLPNFGWIGTGTKPGRKVDESAGP